MSRKYNLVIFGASGFTGQFVVEEMAKTVVQREKDGSLPLTWAVAGRSIDKLKGVLRQASEATGVDLKNIDIIVADTNDPASLEAMAKQTEIVLNCVGPYRFFGEIVVTACVEQGTHHVDISGEPQFLEKIQLLYNKAARDNGAYVVGSCGFDSIPADLGVVFLQQQFKGDLNSVESYLESESGGKSGGGLHYGTWQSAIYGIASAAELRPLRQELFPETLPKPRHKIKHRGLLHNNEVVNGWCLPFPGSDRSVVMRSQRYFYQQEKQRPVQMQAYIKMSGLFTSIMMIIGAVFFGVLAQFKIGRYLMEKYPRLMSLGYASHEGPTRDQANSLLFTFTLKGEGWADKLAEGSDQHSEPPNKTMIVKVKGRNPGYGATCTCMIQAALTILEEKEKLPKKAGVYPPGFAFAKTSLIDRLNKNGVTFTVENK